MLDTEQPQEVVCQECGNRDTFIVKVDAIGYKPWSPTTGLGELQVDDVTTDYIECGRCGAEIDIATLEFWAIVEELDRKRFAALDKEAARGSQ